MAAACLGRRKNVAMQIQQTKQVNVFSDSHNEDWNELIGVYSGELDGTLWK